MDRIAETKDLIESLASPPGKGGLLKMVLANWGDLGKWISQFTDGDIRALADKGTGESLEYLRGRSPQLSASGPANPNQ